MMNISFNMIQYLYFKCYITALFFLADWSCDVLARNRQTIKINYIYLFCNVILFKKVRKSKRGQCRKCFPQKKSKLWNSMTAVYDAGNYSFSLSGFVSMNFPFFPPPLKTFLPSSGQQISFPQLHPAGWPSASLEKTPTSSFWPFCSLGHVQRSISSQPSLLNYAEQTKPADQ